MMTEHTGFSPGVSVESSSLQVTSSGSYTSPQPPSKMQRSDDRFRMPAAPATSGRPEGDVMEPVRTGMESGRPEGRTDVVSVSSQEGVQSVVSSTTELLMKRELVRRRREFAEQEAKEKQLLMEIEEKKREQERREKRLLLEMEEKKRARELELEELELDCATASAQSERRSERTARSRRSLPPSPDNAGFNVARLHSSIERSKKRKKRRR